PRPPALPSPAAPPTAPDRPGWPAFSDGPQPALLHPYPEIEPRPGCSATSHAPRRPLPAHRASRATCGVKAAAVALLLAAGPPAPHPPACPTVSAHCAKYRPRANCAAPAAHGSALRVPRPTRPWPVAVPRPTPPAAPLRWPPTAPAARRAPVAPLAAPAASPLPATKSSREYRKSNPAAWPPARCPHPAVAAHRPESSRPTPAAAQWPQRSSGPAG